MAGDLALYVSEILSEVSGNHMHENTRASEGEAERDCRELAGA